MFQDKLLTRAYWSYCVEARDYAVPNVSRGSSLQAWLIEHNTGPSSSVNYSDSDSDWHTTKMEHWHV